MDAVRRPNRPGEVRQLSCSIDAKLDQLMLSHTAKKRLEQLPNLSRQGKRINGLFNLMKCDAIWDDALRRVARNKGASTPGVDGLTFKDFGPDKMRQVQAGVFNSVYRPHPARRVYIPKANGKKRPLGIPIRAS